MERLDPKGGAYWAKGFKDLWYATPRSERGTLRNHLTNISRRKIHRTK